jgi:uncharacterized protein YjbJ (UPF0337 family)
MRWPDSLRMVEHLHIFRSFMITAAFNKGNLVMNWDRVEGNWKQLRGKVRQQWGKLTDDDIDLVEGRREELTGRLQQRYGMAKDEAERQIDAWLAAS